MIMKKYEVSGITNVGEQFFKFKCYIICNDIAKVITILRKHPLRLSPQNINLIEQVHADFNTYFIIQDLKFY